MRRGETIARVWFGTRVRPGSHLTMSAMFETEQWTLSPLWLFAGRAQTEPGNTLQSRQLPAVSTQVQAPSLWTYLQRRTDNRPVAACQLKASASRRVAKTPDSGAVTRSQPLADLVRRIRVCFDFSVRRDLRRAIAGFSGQKSALVRITVLSMEHAGSLESTKKTCSITR